MENWNPSNEFVIIPKPMVVASGIGKINDQQARTASGTVSALNYTYTIDKIRTSEKTEKELFEMFFEWPKVNIQSSGINNIRGNEILWLLDDENFVKKLGKIYLSEILIILSEKNIGEEIFHKNHIIEMLDDTLGKTIMKCYLHEPIIIDLLKKQEYIDKINSDELLKIFQKNLDSVLLNAEDLRQFVLIPTIQERIKKDERLKDLLERIQREHNITHRD
jgi:PHD/YefM family antitoxin component YafN of YafNO toxin-antitoxin module